MYVSSYYLSFFMERKAFHPGNFLGISIVLETIGEEKAEHKAERNQSQKTWMGQGRRGKLYNTKSQSRRPSPTGDLPQPELSLS